MNDLATAFDALVDDPPVSPEPIEDIAKRADHLRHRRARRRTAVSTMCCAVVVVGTAFTISRSHDSDLRVATQPPIDQTPSTAVATTTTTKTPIDPATQPPPFKVPAGFVSYPAGQFVNGSRMITYGLFVPSTVVKGGFDASINVTLIAGATPATQSSSSVVDLAASYTRRSGFQNASIGGRSVAVLNDAEVVSGQGLGQPDRHGSLYVFTSGSALVELSSTNVADDTVGSLIATFDDAAANAIVGAG